MAKSIKNSRVLKQITDRLGSGASSLKLKKFAEIYFHGTPDRELKNIRQGSESHAKQSYENFLTWNGKAQVKVFNPDYTHYTVAEIQIADQPFLVDTVWGELHRRGFEIHHTFHPVIAVARDKNCKAKEFNLDFKKVKGKAKFESFIHVEFDYQASKEELLAIKQGLLDVLQHAYNVSEDFVMMRSRMDEIFANKDIKLAKEEKLFLEWILDNNFIFLGYRHYDITRKSRVVSMKITKGKGLGILQNDKDSSLYKSTKLKDLPTNMQDYISNKESLTLTKALTKSPVHRVVDMDYIGIKEVNSKGQIIGEHRFLGAFTSRAYTSNPREIPLVRKKIDKVLAKTSYFSERTHNSKALMNILETYPRDELFQISVDDLHRISLGILNLKERQQVRLFVRRSTHERLVTAMVFIPRDRMTSGLRKKVVNIISEAYNAEDVEYMTTLGESLLARIFMKIRCCPPEPPEISDDLVENRLIEVARSWSDALNVSLCEKFGERQGHKFFKNYCSAFRVGYQENTKIEIAVEDIENAEKVLAGKDFSIAISSDEDGNSHLKVFNLGQRINLSEIMPLFNNMGLKITDENPTCIRKDGEHIVWLHDFGVGYKNTPYCKTLIESESRVANALEALWHGELENDSLNSLIVSGGLDTRQVVILRALVAYLQQIYPRYSREYMRNTLINHPNIANKLLELFDARFNPNLSKTERGKQQDVLMKKVTALLETVSVLDEDIIIRRVLNIIQAMVRTNVWQRKEYTDPLAFKICSSDIEDLVKPHPLFEIFVYHNSVEGVHLRGGMVARGGLRWSDRPADFRTEVLGLMKAQMTKNAVIVPVGSKGGFVLKQAPCDLKNMEACDRDALSRSVENAYKTFVGSLLSITDNVEAGKTLYPKNVVRYDDDDVYLVVAADKGTATFSDIANNLAINADYWAKSKQKGFWLGDAFASGGSNGYDHKKMGITARGAWECVKYHFMELGKDIQNKDFTVVGIGDMAGDVFGNGMLLSKHIKLQAAFNHRHIFLDPNPNTAKSWKERERMFKTPRITWADYDKKLISKGGGVFNRNAKSIEISPEIGKMLGISAGKVTPDILIKAILSMEVDLLWNGGIGTFFKSNQENHSQVGDKANDAIRLNAREIKAKVVGEGGNLGFTQLSRIEYAMQGGKINTDSIDNSAGVNCSDNEVNIKILLNAVQEDSKNKLNDTARNKLLAEMTADVGLLSLEANYYQSQILSIAQEVSRKTLATHIKLIHSLEQKGGLDPKVEFLPDEEEMEKRLQSDKGLTRSELSVLMAYTKSKLFDDLLDSTLPDDEFVKNYLYNYFPKKLQSKYKKYMDGHRLRREIIATSISNELVNRMGLTFVDRMSSETGHNDCTVVRAYLIAKELLGVESLWTSVDSLDNKISTEAQQEMRVNIKRLIEGTAFWLLRHGKGDYPLHINETIAVYKENVNKISANVGKFLTPTRLKQQQDVLNIWIENGLSKKEATCLSVVPHLFCAMDVASTALHAKQDVIRVLELYFTLGYTMHFDKLHRLTRQIIVKDNWQRIASLSILEDLYNYQREITRQALKMLPSLDKVTKGKGKLSAKVTKNNGAFNNHQIIHETVNQWLASKSSVQHKYQDLIAELSSQGQPTHAMLNVTLSQLKGLVG